MGRWFSCCTHLLVLPLPAGAWQEMRGKQGLQARQPVLFSTRQGSKAFFMLDGSSDVPFGSVHRAPWKFSGCSSTRCPGGSLRQGYPPWPGSAHRHGTDRCAAGPTIGQEVCNAAGCKSWLRGDSSLLSSQTCLTSTFSCPGAALGEEVRLGSEGW